MKARIITEKELVLLYRLNPAEGPGKAIVEALNAQRVPYREVGEDMLGETVGYLAGLSGYEKATEPFPGEKSAESVMVFQGLSESRLNRVLKKLPAESADVLKAVVTPSNRDWMLVQLISQLSGEREAFAKLEQK